jgi:multidrug efflux pump
VAPLVIAEGAGAEMRQALGTAVFGGMLGVTIFGVFLTPVFFYVIEHMAKSRWFSTGLLAQASAYVLGWMRLRPLRRAGSAALQWMLRVTASSPAAKEEEKAEAGGIEGSTN